VKFEQAQHVPAGSTISADVCVIGSGAAGITVAKQLCDSPLSVILLEAGALSRDKGTEAEVFRIEHLGLPYSNPIPTRGRWFGGSTNLWFGRIATLDPIDFEARAWVPHSGWPIGPAELEPWLSTAARILDVPNFQNISLTKWESNSTIESFPPNEGVELGVFLWARELSLSARYGRSLRAARNVRVLLEGTAVDLIPNEASTKVDSLTVSGPVGNRFTVRATTFVLAAGGLENPRLLLSSNRCSASGLGNEQDLVGRYYMDHPRGEGLATVDLRGLSKRHVASLARFGEKVALGSGQAQFRLTFPRDLQRDEELLNHSLHAHVVPDTASNTPAFESARRLKGRMMHNRSQPEGSATRDVLSAVRGTGELARLATRRATRRSRPGKLVVIDQMEQEPDPLSRVLVDRWRPDRFGLPQLQLNWRVGDSTYRSQRRMHQLFKDSLERQGIHSFQSQLLDGPEDVPALLDMKHHMGTTRMSSSPISGVVDSDCKVHGVNNLYVAGSSVFPTAGHANPTLTIVALAARLASFLLEE